MNFKIMAYERKEVIRLRRKATQSGESLYLDIYFKGKRRYEFLRLYLIPERTKADRLKNEQTLRLAIATNPGEQSNCSTTNTDLQRKNRCQPDRVYTTGCRKQTETGKNRNQGNFRHSGLPFDKISWG